MNRPRRYRKSAAIRQLIQETHLSASDFIVPLFIHDHVETLTIESLPGQYRYDEITLLKKCETLLSHGLNTVALFPAIQDHKKSLDCDEALNINNLMCHMTKRLKSSFGQDLTIVGDVALDPYSIHGQDGLIDDNGNVLNDETVAILAKMAEVLAQAGVDIVAPSDMMDGRVDAIRTQLDNQGLSNTLIMSYTAKYASVFYGPFRDALNSVPKNGDKKTYQMNPANRKMASLELQLDCAEAADIVMVKPASAYLDIISDFSQETSLPVAGYHTSGEYAMLFHGANHGLFKLMDACLEVTLGIKRAGASIILSYAALDIVQYLKNR